MLLSPFVRTFLELFSLEGKMDGDDQGTEQESELRFDRFLAGLVIIN